MEWKDIAPDHGPAQIREEINFAIATLRASGASDNALVDGVMLALFDTIRTNDNFGMGLFWLKEIEKHAANLHQAVEDGLLAAAKDASH